MIDKQNINKDTVFKEKQNCNAIKAFCNGKAVSNEIKNSDMNSNEYLISPFGEFVQSGIIQKIDKQAGENLKRNLNGLWAKIKNTFGNACPVYFRHPDEEDILENPTSLDKTAYGKVKNLNIKEDGIYANIEWLDGFSQLPKKLQFSPRWLLDEIGENKAIPIKLISLGLTHAPNIKTHIFANEKQQQKGLTKMTKEILTALGFSEDESTQYLEGQEGAITENDILEKIKSLSTSKNEESQKEENLTLQNKLQEQEQIALANEEAFQKERTARANLIISNAITCGKITEAMRDGYLKILANAQDFESEIKKLEEAQPVIKTQSQTGTLEKKEKENQKAAANAEKEFMEKVKEKEKNGLSYADAWEAVKKEKSDLFKQAFPNE